MNSNMNVQLSPIVTGIAPLEGPPGKKVIIRGENFGERREDLFALTICGIDCLMSAEWQSSHKIIARSGNGIGKGDIIVTTVKGGRGSCTVQFKGTQEAVGPLKKSNIWVDETLIFNMAFGRKRPLSPIMSLQEDPLGLSVEAEAKFPQNLDPQEMFPDGSGDLTSPQFSPEWFLLENHSATSYEDLRAGLACLKGKVERQREGQISFLKANVGSVIEQLDTLQELKCKFESDIQEFGRESMTILEKSIVGCKHEADKLFEDVLSRKDRADSTRNALNVLHRFRFLLFLPVNIERHVRSGEYDVVINDYARAKSLFKDMPATFFQRFFDEVEFRIEELRKILWQQLIKMPSSLEKQKSLIRSLHYLESSGDPAWQCILSHHSHIMHLLIGVRDAHLEREVADSDLGVGSSAITTRIAVGAATPAAAYTKIMASSLGEFQTLAPTRVLFVEELCDVLVTNLPNMWKLSQAYFEGDLMFPISLLTERKQNQETCKEMIIECVTVFCGLMKGAMMPASLDENDDDTFHQFHVWPENVSMEQVTPWLPQVVRETQSCFTSILSLELPSVAVDLLQELLFDLRMHCLTSFFEQTTDHVYHLYQEENWKLEIDDDNGGRTHLPNLCETVILECAQSVRETTLETTSKETSLLENASVRKEIGSLLYNSVVAFAKALDELTTTDPDDTNNSNRCNIGVGIETQLLITLSNCAYTKDFMLSRLCDALVKASYPKEEILSAISSAKITFAELQNKLFEAYLEERVDPIIGTIERSMYLGDHDWGQMNQMPNDVRLYVREIVMNVTQVHAEVAMVWPGLVSKLVCRVIEGVGEEMARLISCVAEWSPGGQVQAHVDLAALLITFANYMSAGARSSFQEAVDSLPKLTSTEQKTKEKAIQCYCREMKLFLISFEKKS